VSITPLEAEFLPPPPRVVRPKKSGLDRRRSRTGLIMSAPAFFLVAALLGIPIFQAVYLSFTDWQPPAPAKWVGPSTYITEFKNPQFWRVLENNLLLLLAIPFAILIPLGIAFLLNERVPGWRFFRTVYFLPTAISWVVIGSVALRFFAGDGMLNHALEAIGFGTYNKDGTLKSPPTDMLASERWALVAVAITFVWSMIGTNTIIFLTGMAALDSSLAEAARVDGASQFQTLLHITLPQLKRFIQFAVIMTLISAFTALFSLIFVMTGGGPGFGTTTLEFFVYQTGFAQGYFGTGAMLGIILFFIMAVVGLAQVRILRSKD
jgi:multiple sugar transport system permease protein